MSLSKNLKDELCQQTAGKQVWASVALAEKEYLLWYSYESWNQTTKLSQLKSAPFQ